MKPEGMSDKAWDELHRKLAYWQKKYAVKLIENRKAKERKQA